MNKQIAMSAILLGLFTIFGTGLLLLVDQNARPSIERNERDTLLARLGEIIPSGRYDNDLLSDKKYITAPEAMGTDSAVAVYLARQDNKPVAAILSPVAPNGYNGSIHLLVGIDYNDTVIGVRVVKHKETPGLGDGIDIRKSNWILDFNEKSLTQPNHQGWAVKKDGGEFDGFTGATITPRAVVQAVHKSLQYFSQQKETLFATEEGNTSNSE